MITKRRTAYAILFGYLASLGLAVERATAGYGGLTQTRYANAWCESGGNIHAIGYRGMYRGKWQFDRATWRELAPPGWKNVDPAWAPEWVQDRAALNAKTDRWPNC